MHTCTHAHTYTHVHTCTHTHITIYAYDVRYLRHTHASQLLAHTQRTPHATHPLHFIHYQRPLHPRTTHPLHPHNTLRVLPTLKYHFRRCSTHSHIQTHTKYIRTCARTPRPQQCSKCGLGVNVQVASAQRPTKHADIVP